MLDTGRVETGPREADWIVEHARLRSTEDPEELAMAYATRRAGGEPLQYILGSQPFRGRDISVGPGVFIPRPETELVVEHALAVLPARGSMVDLCTGSGAIPAASLEERPDATVYGTERSPEALRYARRNTCFSPGVSERIFQGDLFAPLPRELRGTFDVVVSNPPYISPEERDRLPEDVVAHEPHEALFANDQGFAVSARILAEAPGWLAPGGALVLEIGETQGPRVTDLARASGFEDVRVEPDLAGRDRVLVARTRGPWEDALSALRSGECVLLPTDTVYGLAAVAHDPRAVARIFELKGRPSGRALPVLVHNLDAAARVVGIDASARSLLARAWPGPLTVVLRRAAGFDADLGGHDPATVGVRIPARRDLLRLLAHAGPLAVTSANRSGEPPARTAAEARAIFPDLALYEGDPGSGEASTVVSLIGAEPEVLREGALSIDEILGRRG